jgi:hypothetical protein
MLALGLGGVACKARRPPIGEVERLVPLGAPGAGDADAGPPDAGARRRQAPVRPITDRPAVTGALGVRFGMSRAEVLAQHQAGECTDSERYTFCRRALVALPVPGAVVTYEFCGATLCGVALDGTRTRDEAQLQREYEALERFVAADLGAPSHAERRIGPGCSGHLPLCLASRQAVLAARWQWTAGPQVAVSADPLEDDALQAQVAVTWLSAAGVAAQVDPSAPTPDAGTTPRRDGGPTVAP